MSARPPHSMWTSVSFAVQQWKYHWFLSSFSGVPWGNWGNIPLLQGPSYNTVSFPLPSPWRMRRRAPVRYHWHSSIMDNLDFSLVACSVSWMLPVVLQQVSKSGRRGGWVPGAVSFLRNWTLNSTGQMSGNWISLLWGTFTIPFGDD